MWEYNHTDELKHYGVMGMKWGVRRYQNKDGTLTTAGKRRTKTFKEKAKEHDAKTQARDKARQEKVSNAVKTFKEKAKEHDAKTQARDKARQEKVSKAAKTFKEKATPKWQDIKKTEKRVSELRKSDNLPSKLLLNRATYRKADRLIQKHNMDKAEALKKAKGQAWANTAMVTLGVTAYAILAKRNML